MKLRPSWLIVWMMCGAISAARVQESSGEPRSEGIAASKEKTPDASPAYSTEIIKTISVENEIPKKFRSSYFEERPKSFLIDPQGLLSRVDYKDRLGFLNYHADDSAIDLYVYVFKGDQEIPFEVRGEELVERFFKQGRPAAVIFYYMGKPQRAVLHLSPELNDGVLAAEQKRAMESAVIQASKDADPARQFEGFLVQMSIRIYWMEKMLEESAVKGDETGGVTAATGIPVLKPTLEEKLQPVIDEFRHFTLQAAAGGVLIVGLMILAGLKRRSRYRFPDFEVEPRLGGPHAAGVGAVISFVSAAVPPASQRDQVPDYLRRA